MYAVVRNLRPKQKSTSVSTSEHAVKQPKLHSDCSLSTSESSEEEDTKSESSPPTHPHSSESVKPPHNAGSIEMQLSSPNNGHETSAMTKKVKYRLNGEVFELYHYYTPTKWIGDGAYSSVIEAIDTRTGMTVAIKKNKNVFAALLDGKRILRELKLMLHLNHPNIIQLLDIVAPGMDERETFDSLYLVMTRMDTSLSTVLKSRQSLSAQHKKYFIYQMLRSLKYLQSINVIHRDLKPANILLSRKDCGLKLIDFGLSRAVTLDEREELSRYVVTRYYRAPELLCFNHRYTNAVDIWSVGCILAEMHRRKIFMRGANRFDQLALVLKHCGGDSNALQWIETTDARKWVKNTFFQSRKVYAKNFSKYFSDASEDGIDIMRRMLEIDPSKRITVDEALQHPWLASFHKHNATRPIYELKAPPFDLSFEFEKSINSEFGLRHLMWEELQTFKDKLQKKAQFRKHVTAPKTTK